MKQNPVLGPVSVPFDSLYLDPNNPRLARDDPPGYGDPKAIFDPKVQEELEVEVSQKFDVADLEEKLIGQGWVPIDVIIVWTYPQDKTKHVVVEGNCRTVTLRKIRRDLPEQKKKLEKLLAKKKLISKREIETQQRVIADIERIIAATDTLTVLPVDAADEAELQGKLRAILSVRHISGARGWGNFAEDIWFLARYKTFFEQTHPEKDFAWDQPIIDRVADEMSISRTRARRALQASQAFSHFKAHWEDELPEDEAFTAEDYYLFENVVKKPWLRDQFGFGADALNISAEGEKAIFKWAFAKQRGRTADDNENVFYRHENLLLWEKMHRDDQSQGTDFASRLDVTDPDAAPSFKELEADWLAHKARRKPADVIEGLLRQLNEIKASELRDRGAFLKAQLVRLGGRCRDCIVMIDAAPSDDDGAKKPASKTPRKRKG